MPKIYLAKRSEEFGADGRGSRIAVDTMEGGAAMALFLSDADHATETPASVRLLLTGAAGVRWESKPQPTNKIKKHPPSG